MRQAVGDQNLIELAVAYGGEITSAPFVDVLETADKPIVALFVAKGADPMTDTRSHANRRRSIAMPSVVLYQGVFAETPAKADPLFQRHLNLKVRLGWRSRVVNIAPRSVASAS